MTLQQLIFFIVVAETRNITTAAQRLYISQPTVSRQILMLERELGYPLFNRKSKPLRLTEPGETLYEGVKEAIAKINTTLDTAKVIAEGKNGCLSVAFQVGYYSEYMFFPIIEELRESWSGLQIHFHKMTTTELHRGLENESVDIAIGVEFPHWVEAGFQVKRMEKEKTLIVMSKKHRLAGKEALEYNDLNGETFYLTAPNGYQIDSIFQNVFNLEGVKQEEVPSSEIAYFKVLSDNGLTISNPHDPYLLNNPYYHSIEICSEQTDCYVCVTNPNNTNPAIRLFLNLVGDRCAIMKKF